MKGKATKKGSSQAVKKLTAAPKNSAPVSGKKTKSPPAVEKNAVKTSVSFFEDVWDVVRQIPKGRATSYGAIANYLGTKMSARMVGWAMNAVHGETGIPAQRVVNRNGMLSGKAHFGEPDRMQKLLEKDGLKVENGTILHFREIFWDPAIELSL